MDTETVGAQCCSRYPCGNVVHVPIRLADEHIRVLCPDCIRDEEVEDALHALLLLRQMPDNYYFDEMTGRWTNG